MWETVDLRELRVFLALAEELHFGRTAERLELTPSRVSQSLRTLEQKLGGQLVFRTSRHVELTPLGERFQREAGAAYEQLTGVLERTHTANHALEGTLRLFMFSPPSGGPHLLDIVAAFERRHPECQVRLDQLAPDDVLRELRRGEVHLITTWLPLTQPDIVVGPTLSRQDRVLVVGDGHPFAGREHVSVEEIAEYDVAQMVDLPRELVEVWFPPTTPQGKQVRFTPVRRHGLAELALRIARGEFVHATVRSAAEYLGPDIEIIPIRDLPKWVSALAWLRGTSDPKVHEFVRVAQELLPPDIQADETES